MRFRSTRLYLRLLAGLMACGFAVAGATGGELSDKVDELAKPYVDSQTVVGMTVGVVRGGETVVRGYGQLSSEDARTPDGQTLYEIGSVSKVFTGLLLADAVTAGRVELTTPVSELLPPGVTMNQRDESVPVQLISLSTHTSGLPRLPDNLDPADPTDPYADYGGKQLAAFLKSYRPRKRPGERMEYSNFGVGMLGTLLAFERKSDYGTLLGKRVTQPLGLTDTTLKLNAQQRERLAPPHFEGGVPGNNWTFDKLAGAGAILSTGEDLVKFALAQLNPPGGPLGESIDLAWKVHQEPIADGDLAMGLGWHVARDGSTRWHNGQTGGYHAALFVSRRFSVAAVVLTNTATGEVDALAGQLIRMLIGADEKPRQFDTTPAVDPAKLRRLAGKYQLAPGVVFTVTAKDGKLMVGLTGQPTFRVYPRSDTEWYYKVVEATLTFDVDASGKCNAVELFQDGVRQKARRIL